MCFSASASFGASAILGLGGVYSLKQVRQPKEYLLAISPFLFSVQQLCEGFLWLGFKYNNQASIHLFSILFLLFAQILWPSWVPLCLLLPERNKQRRQFLFMAFLCGFFVSLVFGVRMFTTDFETSVSNHHIYYNLTSVAWIDNLCKVMYVIAIVLAPFLSSMKGALYLALSLLLSFLVSLYFFNENLISVWCFIAALISVMIILMLKKQHSKHGV